MTELPFGNNPMTKIKNMFLTNIKRLIRSGWKNFWRNGWLSVATISVMVLTLFVVSTLVLVNLLAINVLADLQSKMDISVYFKYGIEETRIMKLRSDLLELPEVGEVEYVSEANALALFKEKHKDNQLLLAALNELNNNPLQASLNIKAKDPSQYAMIANFVSSASPVIDKVNYLQNKEVIDKFSAILTNVRQFGLTLTIILAIIAILVTFNTIRLTMFAYRQEIEIMHLVGASNWNIRWPFIIEGVIYGVFAGVVCLAIIFPTVAAISPKLSSFLAGFDAYAFLKSNIFRVIFLQIAVGITLGIVSSAIAIRRYLKI